MSVLKWLEKVNISKISIDDLHWGKKTPFVNIFMFFPYWFIVKTTLDVVHKFKMLENIC